MAGGLSNYMMQGMSGDPAQRMDQAVQQADMPSQPGQQPVDTLQDARRQGASPQEGAQRLLELLKKLGIIK